MPKIKEIYLSEELDISDERDLNIYVISTPTQKLKGIYKVGIHTGDQKSLIKRYLTSLPDLEILLFLETISAAKIEATIKKLFKNDRIENYNNNLSEWIKLPDGKSFCFLLNCIMSSLTLEQISPHLDSV